MSAGSSQSATGGLTSRDSFMGSTTMPEPLRVQVEIGPRGKKLAVVAQGWPGLSRGGATEEKALETLRAYIPRDASVVRPPGGAPLRP